jgi:phage-related protein
MTVLFQSVTLKNFGSRHRPCRALPRGGNWNARIGTGLPGNAPKKWAAPWRSGKDLDESLRDFIKRKGGINKCATRYTRRLGRGARVGD